MNLYVYTQIFITMLVTTREKYWELHYMAYHLSSSFKINIVITMF